LDTAAPSTEISIAEGTQQRGRKDREVSKKVREHTRKDRKDRMEGENTTWHARENALGDAIGQLERRMSQRITQPDGPPATQFGATVAAIRRTKDRKAMSTTKRRRPSEMLSRPKPKYDKRGIRASIVTYARLLRRREGERSREEKRAVSFFLTNMTTRARRTANTGTYQ
jgi:hypothetical protein